MERRAFLARVRHAAAGGRLPVRPAVDPGLLVPGLGDADVEETFERALAAVDGELHRGEPLAVLGRLLDRHGSGPFLAWGPEALPVGNVHEALVEAGCEPVDPRVPGPGRAEHLAGYERVHLGVTGAEAGFAQSGSIVVRSGPDRPRMASLVPFVHVAFLERSRILRSLAHWAAEAAATMGDATNVVFITGPSRTADIEQQLNLGVHGPRHLHVVLVDR